jgi:ATP-dependent DNA ligase
MLNLVLSYSAIVAAVEALAVRTCTIDGEVIVCNSDELADFELLRYPTRRSRSSCRSLRAGRWMCSGAF